MSTVNVQANQSFTVRDSDTGELVSYAYGQIYVVDSAVASAWASAGLASEYTGAVAKPYGNKAITTNAQVDVAEYATAQVSDANLTAANIKKNVTILGVTGSYEGT